MAHLVVDDAQAKVIAESAGRIEIRDRHGKHLGYVFTDFTPEDIEMAKQRRDSDEPRRSTQEVLDHLQSLTRP
jgi:hypothetical protein